MQQTKLTELSAMVSQAYFSGRAGLKSYMSREIFGPF